MLTEHLVAQYLDKLRLRLLDLTGRNRLLNFRFSERSRTQIRIVDELPDQIFETLEKGTSLTLSPLPEPPEHPTDENDDAFRLLLEAMRDSDEEYKTAVEALDEVDEDSEDFQRIERELRDKVRLELVMPPQADVRSMSKSDYAKLLGIRTSYEMPTLQSEEGGKPAHRDRKLQTLLYPEELGRKLAGLREGARKSIQETGLRTLYIAFGMLEWYESDDSDKRLLAPLLLYPVTIERQLQDGQYHYTIQSCGDEPEKNWSLVERLKLDYGIVLPDFASPDDIVGPSADTPECYFEKIEHVIRDRSRWRVRRFLTLSLFSFGGTALFHDLDPDRWPKEASILRHPLISSILCGQENGSQDVIAPDYEVDLPDVAKKVPLLITDADASQFSSIADAMDGKNLVIEGPPGTGKSQTITNLIAAALAKGQKVLFVAEKKAALEVVYNRLAGAGLENYCLEVHSTATSRKAFYEQLKHRVEQVPKRDFLRELADQTREYQQLKQSLSRYVEILNQPFGRIGKTIQELLWAAQRTNDLIADIRTPPALTSLPDKQATSMTEADFLRKCQHLKEFSQQHQSLIQRYGEIENNPWFGLKARDLSPIDQGDLMVSVKMWLAALQQLQVFWEENAEPLELPQLSNLKEIQQLQKRLESFPQWNDLVEVKLLPALRTPKAQQSITSLLKRLKGYRQKKESLRQNFQDHVEFRFQSHRLKPEITKIQTLNLDKQCTIAQLATISQSYIKSAKTCEGYQSIISQVLGLFDFNLQSSPSNIVAISETAELLNNQLYKPPNCLEKRTDEVCKASNRKVLVKASESCKKLRVLRNKLRQNYNLEACESSSQMYAYAKKLRSGFFFNKIFNAEYRKAKKLWAKIQKQSTKSSSSEIADAFCEIARFNDELSQFNSNSVLRRVCGIYFQGLDTEFEVLVAANTLAANARRKLSVYSQGEQLISFLIKADSAKLEKVGRLSKSKKFRSLLDFAKNVRLQKDLDNQKDWKELAKHCEAQGVKAKQVYEALIESGLKPDTSIARIPGIMQSIEELESQLQEISTSDETAELGCFYQEENTDFERLDATVKFAASVTQSKLSNSMQAKLLAAGPHQLFRQIADAMQKLSNCLEQEDKYRQAFSEIGIPDAELIFGLRDFTVLELERIIDWLNRILVAEQDLSIWNSYHQVYQQVIDDGLLMIVDEFKANKLELRNLEEVYRHIFYRSLLRFAYQQYPELNQFSGTSQAQAREQFQRADLKLLQLYQKQLIEQLSKASITSGNSRGRRSEWTDMALIQNEVNKQKRHISQRELFRRASTALQQLQPCWMMSPASVAQFIPADAAPHFDVVIIDEASQMRPEEALGAIARGKQLVVVGDPKQLPPSDFFKVRSEQEFEDDASDESDVLDDESILDMSLKVFYPARRLKWHYRSRHESLIAFSNQHFYDNSLTVFPSPNNQFAVEYRYVENGGYRSGTNVNEALYVANAAAEFIRQYPHLSLGIVSLNQKQQSLLLEQMDHLFAINPELEQYRAERENTLEPFFIKNLENVQGDERDVIFISTVYGPERPGMPVMQRFGPINSRSGHRRLNVLFTRAKERVVVCSSMKSSDIRPGQAANRGVTILKQYLDYAQTKRLQTAILTGREPDSDFEIFVADRLRQQGYDVVPQVGVSGYFIDLAVVDPQHPTTYLLGIECDGATYHSSKAARDRDRLRQQVLERLGWKIYRIWSTDWFTNPAVETDKLIRFIKTLQSSNSLEVSL